ncbi:hypothetical protein NLU13_8368 [Sarocladium strictum]|uniref:Beta-lactamase-related domain-containing protein n=1 Tax=Sarocladium strictum TaxID=5046 RepID=A0AA39GBJ0_SARSR|nr:hypothetical protein NLU13_8368 [Sarocladium strictum]
MDRLDDILKAHVAQGEDTTNKLLGAAFIVTNKDGFLYSGSAGRSRMDTASRPFGTDTFTWIASCTKLITSSCVLHLVEQGKAGLDDDLRPLVPELAAMQILRGFQREKPILEQNTKPITFRVLLTHTLGLPYDMIDPDVVKYSQFISRTDWCMSWNRNGFNTPIRFTPGEGWLYGPAPDWAGLALEAITGDTLGAYMQRHVLDPLKMQDTGFWPAKLQDRNISRRGVEPVERKEEGGKLEGVNAWQPEEHEIESGGAGLYSTADNYAKFLQGFLRGEVIGEKIMQEMFAPQLNEKQRSAMEAIAYEDPAARWGFVPEFLEGTPINHGLGGIINLKDVEGKRRKGSMTWSGMVNSRWVSLAMLPIANS